MLALAINLVPAGERFTARQQDPTEQMMLREGGFMAAWLIAPGAVEQVVPDVWLDSIGADQSLVGDTFETDSVVHWEPLILRLGFVVVPQGPPVCA